MPPTVSVTSPTGVAATSPREVSPSTPVRPTTRASPACSSCSTAPPRSAPRTPPRPVFHLLEYRRHCQRQPHVLSACARDTGGNTRTATTVNVTVSNTGPPPGAPVAAYGFDETSGTTVTDTSGRNNTGTIAGGAVRTTTTGEVRRRDHLRRRQRHDHGARRQLARPHQRHDARGLGAADRERQLPHRDHQGDDREPRLRAVLELDGVRQQQRAAPVRVDLLQRHRRHGRAAARTPGRTSPPPTTASPGASTSTASRSRSRPSRARSPSPPARCASAGTTSGASGSRVSWTRSASTRAH